MPSKSRHSFEIFFVLDEIEWEAQLVEWRCPLMSHASGSKLDYHGLRACADGSPGPLLKVVAGQAFWRLGIQPLQKLCGHLKIDAPAGSNLFGLLSRLVEAVLDCGPDGLHEVLSLRLGESSPDVSYEELLKHSDAADLFDNRDQDDLKKTVEELKSKEDVRSDFACKLRDARKKRKADVLANPRASASAKREARAFLDASRLKYPKTLPSGELTVKQAQSLCPPPSRIYSDAVEGRWQITYNRRRQSRAWALYGHRESALLCIKWAWDRYTEEFETPCPIHGLR